MPHRQCPVTAPGGDPGTPRCRPDPPLFSWGSIGGCVPCLLWLCRSDTRTAATRDTGPGRPPSAARDSGTPPHSPRSAGRTHRTRPGHREAPLSPLRDTTGHTLTYGGSQYLTPVYTSNRPGSRIPFCLLYCKFSVLLVLYLFYLHYILVFYIIYIAVYLCSAFLHM